MPFVRACSPTFSKCSSMLWAPAIHIFTLYCSKGSCSSLVKWFHRPTCLIVNLLAFALLYVFFRKLPEDPPQLFQLVPGDLALRFHRCAILLLHIFDCLYLLRFNWCALLVFHLPGVVVSAFDFTKLPIHTPPLLPPKTGRFDDWCLCHSTLHFAIPMFLVSPLFHNRLTSVLASFRVCRTFYASGSSSSSISSFLNPFSSISSSRKFETRKLVDCF